MKHFNDAQFYPLLQSLGRLCQYCPWSAWKSNMQDREITITKQLLRFSFKHPQHLISHQGTAALFVICLCFLHHNHASGVVCSLSHLPWLCGHQIYGICVSQ